MTNQFWLVATAAAAVPKLFLLLLTVAERAVDKVGRLGSVVNVWWLCEMPAIVQN